VKAYDLSAFGHITSAKELVASDVKIDTLPSIVQVQTLATWTPDMLKLFEVSRIEAQTGASAEGQKPFDRSGALTRMAYYGAEMGWTDPQVMAVLIHLDDRWEKYSERRDRLHRYLVPILNRARQKIGYSPSINIDGLLSIKKDLASTEDKRLIWGAQDFVDADFPIDWTYEGLLPAGGLGMIVADPGTGKTQLALHMGAHMALGYDEWLKWKHVGSRQKVLFLSLEMAEAPLRLFMETIIESYGEREVLNKNLLIMPLGLTLPLDTKEGQAFLTSILDEYMPDVVIIDSFQASVSKEMTDETAMKEFFSYLAVTRKRHKCSVILIHHNRKRSNEQKKSGEVMLDDVYGSRFISAALDFVVSIRESSPNVLAMDMLKCRLGKRIESFEMTRDSNLFFSTDMDNLAQRFGVGNGQPDTELGI
jgi:archaellum biogenesis ATPase FlaH